MIRRVKSGSAAHALAQESDNPVAGGDRAAGHERLQSLWEQIKVLLEIR